MPLLMVQEKHTTDSFTILFIEKVAVPYRCQLSSCQGKISLRYILHDLVTPFGIQPIDSMVATGVNPQVMGTKVASLASVLTCSRLSSNSDTKSAKSRCGAPESSNCPPGSNVIDAPFLVSAMICWPSSFGDHPQRFAN